ncbi:hypothetical protein Taro_049980 [Colocasia esculenta]|uniref:Uncharacterized protein n=1 Tax=Colocasia esculenta TaxID=4460 RepID=A0A843XCJ2_COLES|nr:hypothetical protein [Colocasia esculenta]
MEVTKMTPKFRNYKKIPSKEETIQGSCCLHGSVERDPRHFSEAACALLSPVYDWLGLGIGDGDYKANTTGRQ